MSTTATQSTMATPAKVSNGKKERKTPVRLPRSDEFATQAKVMNLLQRLPEEKRARVIKAVASLLGA